MLRRIRSRFRTPRSGARARSSAVMPSSRRVVLQVNPPTMPVGWSLVRVALTVTPSGAIRSTCQGRVNHLLSYGLRLNGLQSPFNPSEASGSNSGLPDVEPAIR
ncbi:hypothetical protein BXU09_20085 [Deinococcus sp. LM3]|nr:hypothetical protein BXU09_20085 [Deinococcus sp. LM3]